MNERRGKMGWMKGKRDEKEKTGGGERAMRLTERAPFTEGGMERGRGNGARRKERTGDRGMESGGGVDALTWLEIVR